MESERTIPIKVLDFIDLGLVMMATNNGDLLDFYFTILPDGIKIGPQDLDAYEKIADEVCWDDLLKFEKRLVEEGIWE